MTESGWQPPPAFDEYRVMRPLGRGRMGMVYLAHDELLDRPVAVKFIPTIGDEAMARFLVEARAAARIQHPNVATLYRVGQLDDRPYLIYELVRGTSLDQLPRPVDPAEVLRIGIDLSRGLAAAHRRGVLHRDLKPGNAMLADTGDAKLLDFGVAKLIGEPSGVPAGVIDEAAGRLSTDDEAKLQDLTQGQLLGTPYFMSPEAWRGEATERSDLFSLGLVLYELLAGKGPFRDVPLNELPRAVLRRDAPPLRSAAPGVPEGLAAVIDRCLRRDPRERFASADELLAALEALRPGRTIARVPAGNPYRGLRPFEPEHRALFFGRQRALSQALDRLRVEPFLLVTGDSGVGKSSLCAAGLLPLVSEGALEDGKRWSIARLVPGRAPAVALAAAVAPLIGLAEDVLERLIREDAVMLGRAARRRREDGLLVYIDQLEELTTLAKPAEAIEVAEAIASLAAGLPGVRVLATARSDFLSRLEALPGFAGRVSRALMLLAPLARDEVREAIVGPAAVKGTRFESEAMVNGLVDSTVAAQGAMPLLQFALAELWERRDPSAGVIPQSALDALGGVSGALSRHADGIVASLLPAERTAARALLLRLVTVDRTRARRAEDELVGGSPQARPALDALVRGRLVVATDSPDGTSYEIAHEALLEGWDTLARWLAEEAETRALLHRIDAAAAAWRRHARSADLLWGSRQLAEAASVPREELTARDREFLDASARGAKRATWIKRAVALAVVVAIGAVWVGARLKARFDRDREIRDELRAADAGLLTARHLDDELERARAAAIHAFDAGAAPAGEQAWGAVVALRGRVIAAFRDAAEPVERALLLDASRADLRRRYGELLLERALVAEREQQLDERDELIHRMALYDADGALRRRWLAPAHLAIASDPAGAKVVVRRYRAEGGRLVLGGPESLGATPIADATLPPGSLVLELTAPGRAAVTMPVLAGRDERISITVPLPTAVPDGFAYVPPGRTLFGSGDAESVRAFFKAVPQHTIETAAYLIARRETTFVEYIAFLDDLPPAERAAHMPSAGAAGAQGGMVALTRGAAGWELAMQPGSTLLRATAGHPIRYPERTVHAEQDWLQLPVMAISFEDALAYAAWADRTGRVPRARLCTETEWERAARGADTRAFPHGDVLAPEDANVDETYGKNPASFGPDVGGLHPSSRSPFGVDDLAGNVWEWVTTDATPPLPVARGGSFYVAATTARIANRQTPHGKYRDVSLGMRLCAATP